MNVLINPFFFILFYRFSLILFFIYIKISKTLSDKYYQENTERLQKKACEKYQNLSKEKERQYGSESYKISQERKKINRLSINLSKYKLYKYK